MGAGISSENQKDLSIVQTFTELMDSEGKIIGISTNCGKVTYKLGDKVIIKNDYENNIEVIIDSIDRFQEFFKVKDSEIEIKFDKIIKKVENSKPTKGGGKYGLGFIGSDNIPKYFWSDCSYTEFRIGDIVKYKDDYGNNYILKMIDINNIDKKIKLGDNNGTILDEVPYKNLIEKKESEKELVKPFIYRMNSKVSFIKDNIKIVGKVKGYSSNTDKATNMIIRSQSFLYIKDGSEKQYDIRLDDNTLVKMPKDASLTMSNEQYRVKYMKYKAKYLLQKNNLHNN